MGHLFAFGLGGGSSSDGPLLAPLDLYVASVGLDTNDGLTPATPVLTMAGAYSKIPTSVLGAPVRIHVGTFAALAWAPIPSYEQFNEQGQIIVIGDGAGQPGQNGFLSILPPGPLPTAGAGTTNLSLDCTALAPPPNALQGATVEIAGQRRIIRNNTATEIVPTAAFNPAPAPGTTYDLVIPAATIDLSAGDASACEGTDALYPTIINFIVSGGGANHSLLVDTTPCLKLYGCLFTNLGYLSVRNSQVYAGLAEVLSSNGRNGIHLPELWAALGGVQNWEGWGISSTGDLAQPAVIQSFTGYAVVDGLLWLLPESQFTFLGGYTGAVLADHALLDYPFPTQAIPTLARNAANQYAITGSFLDIRVDNSLSLEQVGDGGGLLSLVDSDVAWIGDCIPNILNNSDGLISMVGGRFELGGSLEFDIPLGASAACLALSEGAVGNIGGGIAVNNNGPEFVVVAVKDAAQLSVGLSVDVLSTTPRAYTGIFLANGAEMFIAGDLNLQSPDRGVAMEVSSLLRVGTSEGGGAVNIINAGTAWAQVFGTQAVVSNLGLTGDIGAIVVGSELKVLSATSIQTTQGAAYISDSADVQLGECTIVDTQSEMPAIYVGSTPILPLSGPAQLRLFGSVSGSGPAIQADIASTVVYSGGGVLASAGTALVVNGDASLIFDSANPTTINAPNLSSHGIDCTGGGHCCFQFGGSPPTFTVGGSELVVGFGGPATALPTALALAEQSSFAAALPTPGSSYSNAGAGSSFTRNF